MILAALLDTLVSLTLAVCIGAIAGFSLAVIAWTFGGEDLYHRIKDWYTRQKAWEAVERSREQVEEDFTRDESVICFDFPEREHSTEKRAS